MGQEFSSAFIYPGKTVPVYGEPPTFPENYGFEEKGVVRKEREMIATTDEMKSMRLDPVLRNYCAHKWIDYQVCARNAAPWPVKCAHVKHDWEMCMSDDNTISRKEYEREQRLLLRQERKNRIAKLKEDRLKQLEKMQAHEKPAGGENDLA